MYRTDRAYYTWLVDVLRQAYMNDTLEAGSACGCGVGNLLLAAGIEEGHPELKVLIASQFWVHAFTTENMSTYYLFTMSGRVTYRSNNIYIQKSGYIGTDDYKDALEYLKLIKLPIDTIRELEWEFETTIVGDSSDEIMFNRLMACISVLDRYFGIPPVAQEETKESFTNIKTSLCTKREEMVLTT